MPSLSTYKKILSTQGSTNGQIRKKQSALIMEQTWGEDIQSMVGYLYDYYHDDEPNLNYELNSNKSNVKIPIDVKYIIHTYKSDDKDQVSYYIQFKPSQECNVDYYTESFTKKCFAEFPIGLYLDLPDNKGVYRRWLICDRADFYAPQFSTWAILPCDYRFCWVYDNNKYKMWGCSRGQSSYSVDVDAGIKINTVDNAKKCKLPFNDISATLDYDQRMIISAPIKTPTTWKIVKIENTIPFGINVITFEQDRYDQHKDYIELDNTGNVIAMWANYYESVIPPEDTTIEIDNKLEIVDMYGEITYSGSRPQIKVGGSYKTFTVNYYNSNNDLIELPSGIWKYDIGGIDIASSVKDILDIVEINNKQIKIKFIGSEDYFGEVLTIHYTNELMTVSTSVEIVGI